MTALLDRLEAYYDAVPRRFARAEECGPFTLFLGEPDGWTYYARPRLGGPGLFDAAALAAATARLRQLELPEVIEWVHETTPALGAAVLEEGSLVVEELPLMVFRDEMDTPGPVEGIHVRLLAPGQGDLLAVARAVADVGFASSGTARGAAGPAERDAALKRPQPRVLELIADGSALVAVAISESDGVVATGRAMPVGDVAEIVGVATLPTARRRGLGAMVTAVLVRALRDRGVGTVFLTAGSEDVARVYSRVGFARVGTGLVAERPS